MELRSIELLSYIITWEDGLNSLVGLDNDSLIIFFFQICYRSNTEEKVMTKTIFQIKP